ncbi:MAG: pyridoxal phosphate-dependent aminotransferase [Bacteroidota bacterium]
MQGSNRINVLEESETLAITKQVRALRAQGHDIVGLTLGEPDFDTPDHIREAAKAAIDEGFTHYPPVAGIPALRQAIADKYQRQYGVSIGPKNTMVSTGAKQSLLNVIKVLVNPRDEVIICSPFWVSYRQMLKMAEAEVIDLQTQLENDYKPSIVALRQAITPRTKMLVLNSPSNPTGSMYSRAELQALADLLIEHPQVYLLSDEIYEHITYGEEMVSMIEFPEIRDRTIVVNGVSKGFAMTGWRIGYAVAAEWIIQLCDKYQGQVTSGASSISQRAALAALNGPLAPTERMRDEFRRRRDWMAQELQAIPGLKSNHPPGAFYFYPDFSGFFGKTTPTGTTITTIVQLCKYLLFEGNVAIIPGTAFGTDNHARISYAYSMEILEAGIQNLRTALLALR